MLKKVEEHEELVNHDMSSSITINENNIQTLGNDIQSLQNSITAIETTLSQVITTTPFFSGLGLFSIVSDL